MDQVFAKDVVEGLSANPKFLPSKYFYDETGDGLFQQIMQLQEYYLTQSEFEIFSQQKSDLLKLFQENSTKFNLVEFGAGDGLKTKVLLEYFVQQQADFQYVPIDISQNVLDQLILSLKKELPQLKAKSLNAEYFAGLKALDHNENSKNVILFLGSNIGNFKEAKAVYFLKQIARYLSDQDLLLIGFDLKKDPKIVRKAYNDSKGVTKAFNLNLLQRINKELGGNFDLDRFEHYPNYDPMTGEARSYLISTVDQQVKLDSVDKTFSFRAWETIFMEISQKYDLLSIKRLADNAGFVLYHNFFDSKKYYADLVFKLKT